MKETTLMKVGVLGHDRESVGPSVGPHGGVIGSGKADVAHMKRLRVQIGESLGESPGQVLVEEELHSPAAKSRRSREAANARQARRSSSARSGKS